MKFEIDKILSLSGGDDIISKLLKEDNPFMISRYGRVEYDIITGIGKFDKLCNNAGFFPDKSELIDQFTNVYIQSSKNIDVLGVWNYKHGLQRKLDLLENIPNIKHYIPLPSLDPYCNNWVENLSQKRLLVVHPFEETIKSQISIKNTLLPPNVANIDIIPAVQTIANNPDNRFTTWFDALEYMKREISKHEFDVCLLGCGAYGLPLASHVKSLNKQAIHVGGALQLLFKIKGKRWESEPDYKFDDKWIRPLNVDKPNKAIGVEDGCYW